MGAQDGAALGPWGMLAGAGLGALQYKKQVQQYNRDKERAVQMEKYSPWTGVHGQMPEQQPDYIQNVWGGANAGAQMQGGIDKNQSEADKANLDRNNALMAYYQKMGMTPGQTPDEEKNQGQGPVYVPPMY